MREILLALIAGFAILAVINRNAIAEQFAPNETERYLPRDDIIEGEYIETIETIDDSEMSPVTNENLAAFLWMIRTAEGTADNSGYQTIYGYKYFNDFSDHPRQKVSAGGYTSDAAGAYQILSSTWDTTVQNLAVRVYGSRLPDFSPHSQDRAAVLLLMFRDAYDDVLAGNFEAAVRKVSLEWASLPFSPYGQPVRSFDFLQQAYLNAGGSVA